MFSDDRKISSGNFCVQWWINKHYWKHVIFYGAAVPVQCYCFLGFIFLLLPSVMESSSCSRKGCTLKRNKSSCFQLFLLTVFATWTVVGDYLLLLDLLSSVGNGSPCHLRRDRFFYPEHWFHSGRCFTELLSTPLVLVLAAYKSLSGNSLVRNL